MMIAEGREPSDMLRMVYSSVYQSVQQSAGALVSFMAHCTVLGCSRLNGVAHKTCCYFKIGSCIVFVSCHFDFDTVLS